MGVACPIGIGLTALEAGLRSARSGTRLIRNWPSEGFPNRLGGEIDAATALLEMVDYNGGRPLTCRA